MNKLPTATEHQIQQLIINYLKYKGWYVLRLNSGKYSVGEGRSKRYIMGQEAGTPDIMAFRKYTTESYVTKTVFIEVKRPGKKPTALQDMKMIDLEEYGAKCIVATSIEDLQEAGL